MFSRIQAENLFSWGRLDYNIPAGISLIDGFNHDDNTSEGSGKSSIPNILCWVLYGKIPKDVKIEEVVKDGAKSGAGVVELESGHLILRSRRPNDLRIINPDGSESLGKDAKETQKLIEILIGMSYDTFCQGVYFAQNYPQKFITANEADKAKILSELQDLTIYDRARKSVHDKEKSLDFEVEILKRSLRSKEEFLENNEEMLSKINAIIKGFYNTLEIRKKELLRKFSQEEVKRAEMEVILTSSNSKNLKEQISQHKEMVEELKKNLYGIATAIQQVNRSVEKKEELERRFKKNENYILDFQNELKDLRKSEGLCPTCGSTFDSPEHKKLLHKNIEKLSLRIDSHVKDRNLIVAELSIVNAEKDVEALKTESVEISQETKKIEKVLRDLETEERDLHVLKKAFATTELNLLDLRGELNKLDSSKPSLEMETQQNLREKCTNTREEVKTLKDKISELYEKQVKYRVLAAEFKSLKSKIFSDLLEEISRKSTELASELFEVSIAIKFFNESEDGEVSKIQTEVILDGNKRSLGLLSGGQARRVQLSVDLALSKIIATRSTKPCNFRILDESFKDLSLSSMEKMIILLKGLAGSTLVIEHNPLIKSIVDSTFFVDYRDGESRHAS